MFVIVCVSHKLWKNIVFNISKYLPLLLVVVSAAYRSKAVLMLQVFLFVIALSKLSVGFTIKKK